MLNRVFWYFAALSLICGAVSAEMVVRTRDGRRYTVPVTGDQVQSIEFVESAAPTPTSPPQPSVGKYDGTWTDTSSTCGGSTYTIRQSASGTILSVTIKVRCLGGRITGTGTGSGFTSKNATTVGWSYRYTAHSPELIESGVSEFVLAADGKSARLTSRPRVGASGSSILVRR
jgi:hypothetical protein